MALQTTNLTKKMKKKTSNQKLIAYKSPWLMCSIRATSITTVTATVTFTGMALLLSKSFYQFFATKNIFKHLQHTPETTVKKLK